MILILTGCPIIVACIIHYCLTRLSSSAFFLSLYLLLHLSSFSNSLSLFIVFFLLFILILSFVLLFSLFSLSSPLFPTFSFFFYFPCTLLHLSPLLFAIFLLHSFYFLIFTNQVPSTNQHLLSLSHTQPISPIHICFYRSVKQTWMDFCHCNTFSSFLCPSLAEKVPDAAIITTIIVITIHCSLPPAVVATTSILYKSLLHDLLLLLLSILLSVILPVCYIT